MKFYTVLCLLLVKYANAQDDNPSGHEVGQRPIANVPNVQSVPKFDDNPSPSDMSSTSSSTSSTTSSTSSTPTPTTFPKVDENSSEKNKWMLIWSMMLML